MPTAAPAAHDPRYAPPASGDAPIRVTRWPSERPLFALSLAVALALWVVICVSVVGLVYALFLGAFFFVVRLAFVAHVRGSAVRLGPDQLPELHARVVQLSQRMGMAQAPETYLMQAGGALNAFATRFLGDNIVVLYSDLLDACERDESARDMIIAHELGHLHAGHLRWHWLILPASFVPFLGSALSRAREYTSDRYGAAGAGSAAGATRGLTILAAGPRQAARVNQAAFVRQREALDTGWMTLGEWLSTHPPLAKRLAQLDPTLGGRHGGVAGTVRAAAIVALLFIVPIGGLAWMAATKLPKIAARAQVAQDLERAGQPTDAERELPAPASP
jgi:Zn-dependent protease with chaperone function